MTRSTIHFTKSCENSRHRYPTASCGEIHYTRFCGIMTSVVTKILRHFLYLNVELVGAFLEQLEGGKLQITESISESRRHIQGGVNVSLLQLGGGGESLTGYKETKTIYYDLYNRLEDALRNEKKLIDLTISVEGMEHRIEENQFFLAHGAMTFTPGWAAWQSIGYILGKINEWIGQQQTLSLGQQIPQVSPPGELADGTRSLVLPNNRPIILLPQPTQINVLPKLPDKPPEEIRALVKPEVIEITLQIPKINLNFLGSGFLKHFTDDRVSELTSGKKTYRAYVMGLISELSEDRIHFTPMAIFVVI